MNASEVVLTRNRVLHIAVLFMVLVIACVLWAALPQQAQAANKTITVDGKTIQLYSGGNSGLKIHQIAQTTNSITLEWDAYPNATAYLVKNPKTGQIINVGNRTFYTLTDLTPGLVISDVYWINANTGWGAFDTFYSGKTLPGKITKLKSVSWPYSSKTAKISLPTEVVAGADYLQYWITDTKTKKTTTGDLTYYIGTIEAIGLDPTHIYTLKTQARTTISGPKYNEKSKVWGAASDLFYLVPQPKVTKCKKANGKLTTQWKKVSGASSYTIYVSAKETSGYKAVKTVSASKSSYTLKKFKGKKISKSKNYYVCVVANKKAGSKTHKSTLPNSSDAKHWKAKK